MAIKNRIRTDKKSIFMSLTINRHSYIVEPYHINGNMAQFIIGKWCSIASNCIVDLGFQHNYKNVTTFPMHKMNPSVPSNLWCKGDIVIENDVWIGHAVTLMSGITIGNGAVIGANTTVRRNILPYEIYTGNKIAEKYRFDYETRAKLLEIAWWNWEDERVLANLHLIVSEDIDNFINNHN